MKLLGLIVEQYLAFAETMAQQHTPMYMKDWIGYTGWIRLSGSTAGNCYIMPVL